MLEEAVHFLDPKPGDNFIDCTLGGGGYSFVLAEKTAPGGAVLAIDADGLAIENARRRIETEKAANIVLVHDNFVNLGSIYKDSWAGGKRVLAGIVFDLGLSSAQLSDRRRGFSFRSDAPLDMAYGATPDTGPAPGTPVRTTAGILKKPQKEIEKILHNYGEEQYAHSIAGAIIKARKKKAITTTGELVEIIGGAVPAGYKRRKIHFATKTFQALRIATNNELDNLKAALAQAVDILPRGGRLIVVAYHSLEDRIVKNYFRQESRDCICPQGLPECRCGHTARVALLTKKTVKPGPEEIKDNPRARSARLRAIIKL